MVPGDARHGQVQQDAARFSLDQFIEKGFRRSVRARVDADRAYQPGETKRTSSSSSTM